MDYSKNMKDNKNVTWPILGVCQGLQAMAFAAGHNDPNMLTKVEIEWKNRNVTWT